LEFCSKRELDGNQYEVLGLHEKATANEIKTAYRKLALKHHPDKNKDKSNNAVAEATEKFQKIQTAYRILSNEKLRKDFDSNRTEKSRASAPSAVPHTFKRAATYSTFNAKRAKTNLAEDEPSNGKRSSKQDDDVRKSRAQTEPQFPCFTSQQSSFTSSPDPSAFYPTEQAHTYGLEIISFTHDTRLDTWTGRKHVSKYTTDSKGYKHETRAIYISLTINR